MVIEGAALDEFFCEDGLIDGPCPRPAAVWCSTCRGWCCWQCFAGHGPETCHVQPPEEYDEMLAEHMEIVAAEIRRERSERV